MQNVNYQQAIGQQLAGSLSAKETRANSIQNRLQKLLEELTDYGNRQEGFLVRMRGSVPTEASDCNKPPHIPQGALSNLENQIDLLNQITLGFRHTTEEMERIA